MESKLLTQQEIQIAKERLLHCLEKFDTKQEKVSQTLFNVYPDEMRAITKLIAQEYYDRIICGTCENETQLFNVVFKAWYCIKCKKYI